MTQRKPDQWTMTDEEWRKRKWPDIESDVKTEDPSEYTMNIILLAPTCPLLTDGPYGDLFYNEDDDWMMKMSEAAMKKNLLKKSNNKNKRKANICSQWHDMAITKTKRNDIMNDVIIEDILSDQWWQWNDWRPIDVCVNYWAKW